jgi:hypothetical protein
MIVRTLGLEKDGHWFCFRYEAGTEDQLVEHVMMMADDRDSPFDWTDAACISFQATQIAAETYLGTAEDTLTME